MRKLFGLLLPIFVATGMVSAAFAATSSDPVTYSGETTTSYFGDGNLPPGCIRDMSLSNPKNTCYHMRTGLNALDSPVIDVLVLAPVSPTAERDLRLMRQAVEMWAGGIDQLAGRMGMPWLKQVEFRITADALSNEFSTYPIIDPEIVVVASNPAGGIGIGIDPFAFVGEVGIYDAQGVPCHGVENPFEFSTWEDTPGFESHHDGRSGTYVEDCGGAGGNVCFAVNGAIDPVPGTTEVFSLFDLVTHEFGHCLTVGHVGDGAEGSWGAVPTNDIMSYNEDPVALTKCVSSLDVEGFALRMSRYVDRDGDGKVTAQDKLDANDLPGDGRNAFQVQSPSDHIYASASGRHQDCPQPDYSLVPGGQVNWGPTPVRSARPELRVKPSRTADGGLRMKGSVTYVPLGKKPTKATGAITDAAGDARSPFNDIKGLDVKVTSTSVEARVKVARLWPATAPTSASSYSLVVNGRRFDSLLDGGVVTTWDNGVEAFVPGLSRWDAATGSVRFRIPRHYLAQRANVAPYYVGAMTSAQNGKRVVFNDDFAPAGQKRIGVTGRKLSSSKSVAPPKPKTGTKPYVVQFKQAGGNTFAAGNSNGGLGSLVSDPHQFQTEVTSPSRLELTLDWADPVSDLDISAQVGPGQVVYGDNGKPETLVFDEVRGPVSIEVNPTLVGPTGVAYTLEAKVTPIGKDSDRDGLTNPGDLCPQQRGSLPSGCPDSDRDGAPDRFDDCRTQFAMTSNGCPAPATEWVKVYVDGDLAESVRVDRRMGLARFDLQMAVPRGRHTVRTVWSDRKGTIASVTRTIG